MGEHSPEPWEVSEYQNGPTLVLDALDGFVMGNGPHSDPEPSTNDMRRIVACVNACRDIPTPLLEHVVRSHGSILRDVKQYGCCAGSPMIFEAITDRECWTEGTPNG